MQHVIMEVCNNLIQAPHNIIYNMYFNLACVSWLESTMKIVANTRQTQSVMSHTLVLIQECCNLYFTYFSQTGSLCGWQASHFICPLGLSTPCHFTGHNVAPTHLWGKGVISIFSSPNTHIPYQCNSNNYLFIYLYFFFFA